MSLRFRDWEPEDDLKLLEIFGDPAHSQQLNDRSLLGMNPGPAAFATSMVAEDDGIPVAAAAVVEQPLHPQRLWFYAEVAPHMRRQGIASAMLAQLREQVAERGQLSTELKARTAVEDEAAAGFLEAHGFSPLNRAQSLMIAAGALPLPELAEEGPLVEDLATGSVELSGVVAEYYNAVHDWDPSEMRLTQAQKLLLAPESGAAGAIVLRDEPRGPIVAFAISYTAEQLDPDSPSADVLIGYNPAVDSARTSQAVADVLALVSAQHPVFTEVDDAQLALKTTTDGLLGSGHATVNLETMVWATDA